MGALSLFPAAAAPVAAVSTVPLLAAVLRHLLFACQAHERVVTCFYSLLQVPAAFAAGAAAAATPFVSASALVPVMMSTFGTVVSGVGTIQATGVIGYAIGRSIVARSLN